MRGKPHDVKIITDDSSNEHRRRSLYAVPARFIVRFLCRHVRRYLLRLQFREFDPRRLAKALPIYLPSLLRNFTTDDRHSRVHFTLRPRQRSKHRRRARRVRRFLHRRPIRGFHHGIGAYDDVGHFAPSFVRVPIFVHVHRFHPRRRARVRRRAVVVFVRQILGERARRDVALDADDVAQDLSASRRRRREDDVQRVQRAQAVQDHRASRGAGSDAAHRDARRSSRRARSDARRLRESHCATRGDDERRRAKTAKTAKTDASTTGNRPRGDSGRWRAMNANSRRCKSACWSA